MLARRSLRRRQRGATDDLPAATDSPTATDGGGDDRDPSSEPDATAADAPAAPSGGGDVVFAAEQWPDCLNPITSCANASWLVWSVSAHILPRLMELDVDGNYRASPVIDEAPSLDNGLITTDPFTVTYRIRDDAVWNDGTPITSEDVRFTWRAILDTTGTLSTSGVDLITDVDTSDPKTVVLTFSEPYAPWADLFGGGTGFILKSDEFTDGTELSNKMLDDIAWSGGP